MVFLLYDFLVAVFWLLHIVRHLWALLYSLCTDHGALLRSALFETSRFMRCNFLLLRSALARGLFVTQHVLCCKVQFFFISDTRWGLLRLHSAA